MTTLLCDDDIRLLVALPEGIRHRLKIEAASEAGYGTYPHPDGSGWGPWRAHAEVPTGWDRGLWVPANPLSVLEMAVRVWRERTGYADVWYEVHSCVSGTMNLAWDEVGWDDGDERQRGVMRTHVQMSRALGAALEILRHAALDEIPAHAPRVVPG